MSIGFISTDPTLLPLVINDVSRSELLAHSSIDPAVARERGYETISRPGQNDDGPRKRMASLGIPGWAIRDNSYFPGLLIPLYRATGERVSHMFKPIHPVPNREGKKMKYAAAKGRASVVDVHPRWSRGGPDDVIPPIRDVTRTLFITEGVKKADSLTSRGLCAVALSGVWNWRSSLGTLGDWDDIPLRDRIVVIVFDADAITNQQVLKAMRRLGRWLRSKGATPRYCIPPAMHNGRETKGADDFFAAGGTVAELQDRAAPNPPEELRGEDMFTDARMVETVADGTLEGDYLYTTAFGWLRWDGRRWARIDAEDVREAIRQYLLGRYVEALGELRDAAAGGSNTARIEEDVDGWHRYQSTTKLDNLVKLASGLEALKRDGGDFDADPDLLVVHNGVVDLRANELLAHSSERLVTRCAAVSWNPDARDEAWDTALKAIPDGAQEWLQMRLGQAVTGYEPDDERFVMLTGGGGNGKTTIMNTIFDALGGLDSKGNGHAENIPSELLLLGKNPGGASPEKMMLRGVRLAYVEETPENRHLDVEALKKVVGTPSITARDLYKSFVTFGVTHSLFLNTNYPPIVAETDDGTWRRLVRVDFPYRFIDPKTPLTEPHHRHGVRDLKRRLKTPGAMEAALAWLVDGALKWYANGMVFPGEQEDPPCVIDATRKWRMESDVVLQFITDELEFTPGKWVPTQIIFERFKAWAETKGIKGWAQRTFIQRLKTVKGLTYADKITLTTHGSARSVPYTAPADTWAAAKYTPPPGKKQEAGVWGLSFG